MANYKQRLRAGGYAGETDQFYREVNHLFVCHFPQFQTDEQLKRHPRQALQFCDMVRASLGLPELTDEIILGALENYRKHRKRLAKTA